MKKTIPSDFITLRKQELISQLSKASNLHLLEDLEALNAQWVHRYGLESLPETVKTICPIEEDRVGKENTFSETNNEMNSAQSETQTLIDEHIGLFDHQLNVSEEVIIESDPKDEIFAENVSKVSEDLQKDLSRISPPPPRNIHHLSRWLPGANNKFLRAS